MASRNNSLIKQHNGIDTLIGQSNEADQAFLLNLKQSRLQSRHFEESLYQLS